MPIAFSTSTKNIAENWPRLSLFGDRGFRFMTAASLVQPHGRDVVGDLRPLPGLLLNPGAV
jgi:hypothetical protein